MIGVTSLDDMRPEELQMACSSSHWVVEMTVITMSLLCEGPVVMVHRWLPSLLSRSTQAALMTQPYPMPRLWSHMVL